MTALLLIAAALILAGGAGALLAGRRSALASGIAVAGLIAGGAVGTTAALVALLAPRTELVRLPSSLPIGELLLRIDPLSALFLAVLFAVAPLTGLYGAGYLAGAGRRRPLGPSWFFFSLLVAGMAAVLLAADAVWFLIAWELMSLAAFFLVTFEDERAESRAAGWTFLVATHVGGAFLIAFFVVARGGGDGFAFAAMTGALPAGSALHGAAFLLALVGFGVKAGFFPLHGWLPEAHPAAPSHVSALMSGVMIKMGIYGLLRALELLGGPQVWWGWLLVLVGAASGVLGVLFALAQHDLKRLLAYHSVENIGIITLGLGLGVLGAATGRPALAFLGLAGGLFHVVNHALFKSLLFLGAGSVLHATGCRHMDELGGLLKRMPVTGTTFLVGAAAITGLPPLNGFASELLVVLAAVGEGIHGPAALALPALAALAALALIGGLAAACFTKAFGVVFLGEPRSGRDGHEAGVRMTGPMVALASLCVLAAVAAPLVVRALAAPVGVVAGALGVIGTAAEATAAAAVLARTLVVAAVLVGLVAVLTLVRLLLLRRRQVRTAPTWDCGYLAPSPRMQYTASSFAQPLVELFAPVLHTRTILTPPAGLFPAGGRFASTTPDVATDRVLRPLLARAGTALARLRLLQHGRVRIYVLYIAVTLIVLLLWKVVRP